VAPQPPHSAPASGPARARPGPSSAGQASLDYAALLSVVMVALAGAGAVAGATGLPQRVVHAVRTGVCIAAGDVCRSADAAAAGLAPCVTGETVEGRGLAVTIVSVHLGRHGSWTVAQRSDGSVLVTRRNGDRAGLAGGLGFELGPLTASAGGTLDVVVAHGSAWELPSAADAARLLAAVRRGDAPGVAPTWRFGDAGEEAAGSVQVSAGEFSVTPLEATAGLGDGVRTGRGERTVYIRVHSGLASPFASLPGEVRGTSTGPDGGGAPLLLGVTRDAHGLRELSFRRAERGARPGQVVETVGRLDLRDPANRAAADALLARRLPWPPDTAAALRALVRRTARVGTVERATYAVQDASHDVSAAVKLGVELGFDLSELDVRRRLVAASAWTAGSPERTRADCLPGAA
jgi:hypothetical protein